MVEVGKGKQEERVPEQSLRSVNRVDYVETALRERESAYLCGNKGGNAIISSFEHMLRGRFVYMEVHNGTATKYQI